MRAKFRSPGLLVGTILTLCFAFTGSARAFNYNDVEEECIWTGRGFTSDDTSRSVMNVRTGCSSGELIWHHPYGGLRVVFHPRDIKGPFKLCFKSRHSGIAISSEGFENVKLLQTVNEKHNKQICIKSTKEHAVLFIQSERKDAKTMKLRYTVTALKRRGHKTPKGCKPCDIAKFMRIMCKSDFVVKGRIESTYAGSDSHDTQANVIARHLLSQKQTIFVKRKPDSHDYRASIRIPRGCNWRSKKQRSYWIAGDVVQGKGAVMTCFLREEAWFKSLGSLFKHLCKNT